MSTPARLAAFAVAIAVALAGGAVVGAAVGPEPEDRPSIFEHGDHG